MTDAFARLPNEITKHMDELQKTSKAAVHVLQEAGNLRTFHKNTTVIRINLKILLDRIKEFHATLPVEIEARRKSIIALQSAEIKLAALPMEVDVRDPQTTIAVPTETRADSVEVAYVSPVQFRVHHFNQILAQQRAEYERDTLVNERKALVYDIEGC